MIKTLALLLLFGCSAMVIATEQANDFLRHDFSARSSALGSADVAVSNRVDGLYSNPAGLSRGKFHHEFSTTLFESFETSYYSAQYVHNIGICYLGFGFINSSVTGITITKDTNNDGIYDVVSTDGFTGSGYYLTASRKLNSFLHIGTNIKYIQQDLVGISGNGIGLDAGIQLVSPSEKYTLGIAVQDITETELKWGTGTTERTPKTIRVGAAGYFLSNQLLLSTECKKIIDTTLHLGAEYMLHPNVSVRTGLSDETIVFGMGLNMNRFFIDMSYKQETYLFSQTVYKLTLGIQFP